MIKSLLADPYKHTTMTSDWAKASPTVQLVRFLVDALAASGDINAPVVSEAEAWLEIADEELGDEPYHSSYVATIDLADPIIATLTGLLDDGRETSLHSLVINWCDNDTEQGTFGTTVRALNHEHAEYLARRDMERSEDAGTDFTGEVVDHNIGASWKADDLEKALRRLVAGCRTGDLIRPLEVAEKLLAEIDAIA